jgi:hypothetical protein
VVVLATDPARPLELDRERRAELVEEPVALFAVDPRLAGQGDRFSLGQ